MQKKLTKFYKKEYLYSFILQQILGLQNWFAIIFIVYKFGYNYLGTFLFLNSLVSFIHIFSNYGAEEYLSVKTSLLKKNAKKILLNLIFFSISISCILYVLGLIIFKLYMENNLLFFIIIGLNSLYSFCLLIDVFVITTNKSKLFLISKIISVIIFFLAITLFYKKIDFEIFLFIFTFSNIFLCIIYFYLIFSKFKINKKFLNIYIKKTFYIFLSSLINFFKLRGTIIILNFFLSPSALGIYGFIIKILETLVLITVSILRIFYSKIIPYVKKIKIMKEVLMLRYINLSFVISFLFFLFLTSSYNFDGFSMTNSNYLHFFLMLYLAIIITINRNYELIIKIFLINNNLNSVIFLSNFISAIIQMLLLIFLVYFYDIKGALISLVINSHLIFYIYFLSEIILKKKFK